MRAGGIEAVALDQPPQQMSGIAAGVWDHDHLSEAEAGELRQFVLAVRPAPVVAVLGFPRIEEQQRAVAAGAISVLSKPLLLADFWACLPLPRPD
jgi:hypothetical protein